MAVESSAGPGVQSWVEPSAELVAGWDAADARFGDPVDRADLAVAAADRLTDFGLVEQVAQFERLASWARARQLVAVEVLSRRASMNPYWPVPVGMANVAAEEVAAVLGASRAVGQDLVEAARLLAGPLGATADALECGQIDWGKARILIGALRTTAGPVAVLVQDRVLPGAGRRTHSQLRTDVARALIAVDPLDAELRQVRGLDERRVCHPKVLPDGMAGIWAVLPAALATAIDTTLDRTARRVKETGDPRTRDQLRADAYTTALLTGPPATTAPTGPDAPTGPGAAFGLGAGFGLGAAAGVPDPTPGARIEVTVALTTLLGLDQSPAELTGYGPITAQTARRLATTGTWRRLVTDPLTGTVTDVGKHRYHPPGDLADIVRARDRYCLSPICATTAARCDLDHREPFRPDGTGGATSTDNLGPLCRRDHLLKTHAGWHLDRDPATTLTWTTPTGHTYPHHPQPPPGHEPPPASNTEWDRPPPF